MKNLYKFGVVALLLMFGLSAEAATLSLSPATGNINVGSNFTVNVALNTQGVAVDGVDVFYLNFNPALLSVVDAASGVSGVQITAGSLMPNTIINDANNTTGRITFSQVPNGGSVYTGTGNLATITFNAKAAGTANVTFDYVSGSTLDSNVASNGADVLSGVTNGSYVLAVPVVVTPPQNQSTTTSTTTSSNTGASNNSSNTTSNTSSSNSSNTSHTVNTSSGSRNNSSNTIVVPATTASTAIKGSVSKNLSFRSEGTDVLLLQQFLVSQGLLTADNQTGFFGRVTEAALQNFQKKFALVTSGTVETTGFGAAGPKTRQFINSMIASGVAKLPATTVAANSQTTVSAGPISGKITERLMLKSEGGEVLLLQKILVQQKLLDAENQTGYFGLLTEAALKQFQKIYGIVSAGTPISTGFGATGPKTREFLNTLLSN